MHSNFQVMLCNLQPRKLLTGWDLNSVKLFVSDFKEAHGIKVAKGNQLKNKQKQSEITFNEFTSYSLLSGASNLLEKVTLKITIYYRTPAER